MLSGSSPVPCSTWSTSVIPAPPLCLSTLWSWHMTVWRHCDAFGAGSRTSSQQPHLLRLSTDAGLLSPVQQSFPRRLDISFFLCFHTVWEVHVSWNRRG
jgi:hypothetical protein